MNLILYVKVERVLTDSIMTYRLPVRMTTSEARMWVGRFLHGWEIIKYSVENPDGDRADDGYDWKLNPNRPQNY